MNELLPCPFCGGEATVTEFNHGCIISCENDAKAWINGKDDADGHLAHIQSRSKAEAIAAWNSRAKPPCGGGYCPLCGAAERTCTIEGSYYDELMDEHYTQLSCDHETSEYEPNYCPTCGARIVGRDDE